MKHNAEVIKTDEGYWINLDKTCVDPYTYMGEVVYFETKREAWKAITKDEEFINKMLILTDDEND